MRGRLLVAGVGNIFLGDDGFGVEVVQRLSRAGLPEDVVVKDFGIRSYDLAYAMMEDWDEVILVDILARGGAPGTLYTFQPQLPAGDEATTLDAHSMNPAAVLQLVTALGGHVPPVLVVGCEPACIEPDEEGSMELSEPVAAAVDEAVKAIQDLLSRARTRKQVA